MEINSENIIISEGTRPFWQTAIAAILYTVTFVLLFIVVFNFIQDFSFLSLVYSLEYIFPCVLTVGFALKYSAVNNVYFDLENKKYKKEIAVGPFKFGKWVDLPNVEYISVFRQAWSKDSDGDGITDGSGYRYDVNVWYNASKHFTIYTNGYPEASLEMGRQLALRLNTDLLDATDPQDKKWIDL